MTDQVGGITALKKIEVTTVDAAYALNDSIGGAIEIPYAVRGHVRNRSGIVDSIKAQFEAAVTPIDIQIYFFTSQPTAVDNAVFAPTVAELKDLVPTADADGTNSGRLLLETANKTTFSTVGFMCLDDLDIPFQLGKSDTSLWMVIVATGAIDFTAGDNLHIALGIKQD